MRRRSTRILVFGEPYGTLVLTVSVIGIEVVMISAVMLPIILLAKKMAALVDHGIATFGAPQAVCRRT